MNATPVPFSVRRLFVPALVAVAVSLAPAGCGFLKPAKSTARHFVLAPVAAAAAPPVSGGLAVGVGQVKLPAYLFDTSFAVRQGTNEILYQPSVLWAERLDTGFQRVLAANLTVLLPTDRIRLSAWNRADVAVELHVMVGQFDVDTAGRGVLVAWWRVQSPGGDTTLRAGETRLTAQGPAPGADPAGAVATLNSLLEDFSRQLATTLQETSFR